MPHATIFEDLLRIGAGDVSVAAEGLNQFRDYANSVLAAETPSEKPSEPRAREAAEIARRHRKAMRQWAVPSDFDIAADRSEGSSRAQAANRSVESDKPAD